MKAVQKIAIQGIKGSFHHQAACECFGETALDECMSFEELAKSLAQSRTQAAIMALENSIAGSIIPNYALIDRNNFRIVGEHYLSIDMNLMALPGQKIEDIREVHSHPIALLQCSVFFGKHPRIRLVESPDTAETAQRIQSEKLRRIAAIAGPKTAEMYGLEILERSIHTIKNNTTRFVILKTQNAEIPIHEINKASLKFELDDNRGALASVLNALDSCQLNLTKIQSMPIVETPFRYSFFVDVAFDRYEYFEKCKKILGIMAKDVKILGEYRASKLQMPAIGTGETILQNFVS